MTRRVCSICANPGHATIDAQLQAGVFQKTIAASFSVSPFALSRHRHNCLKPPAASDTGDSRAEISKWLSRAEDQYLLATANDDQRGAVQSLVAGLRACEALSRSEDTAAESTKHEVDGPLDVRQIDRWTQQLIAALGTLPRMDERMLKIAAAMVDDPELINRAEAEREKQHDFIPQ
jgi:hypothetical protein